VKVARSSRRGNSPQRMRSSYLRKDIYRLDNCNPRWQLQLYCTEYCCGGPPGQQCGSMDVKLCSQAQHVAHCVVLLHAANLVAGT
jgi:hypothetical protein